jgi:hypothetical protein
MRDSLVFNGEMHLFPVSFVIKANSGVVITFIVARVGLGRKRAGNHGFRLLAVLCST